MGQKFSKQKRNSTPVFSTTPCAAAITPNAASTQIELSSVPQEISRPATPPRLVRMSALLDPNDLILHNFTVRSPSGNVLGPNAYFAHPDRPLSMRERQERVRAEIEAAILNANRKRVRGAAEATEAEDAEDANEESWCWCSWLCIKRTCTVCSSQVNAHESDRNY